MKRRCLSLILFLFLTQGCIKETYDMDKLSDELQISPTLVFPAFSGSALFSDIVHTNDTVVFGEDKLVKLIFRKDSVISLDLEDFYNLGDMVAFNQSYNIGELSIASFQGVIGFTLAEMSSRFPAALQQEFESLDDGAAHPFPPFPSTMLLSRAFTGITNFQNAVFTEGYLEISLTNNLPVSTGSVEISLSGITGSDVNAIIMPSAGPGQTRIVLISLAGRTVTNPVSASVILPDNPGNPSPVMIDLINNNIQIELRGRELKVSSGRVVLPPQSISVNGSTDTVSFDAGPGVELEQMRLITGNMSWRVSSSTRLSASMHVTLPAVKRNGIPVTEGIRINPYIQTSGIISINNTDIDLSSDKTEPFNKIPVIYSLSVTSNNAIVNFNSADLVSLSLRVIDPQIDYVKGYFGQNTQLIGYKSVDFGMKKYLDKLSGNFLFTNPSARLVYSNSFAVPIKVALNVQGTRDDQKADLSLAPFMIDFPEAPGNRDVNSSFIIDNNNSALAALISLPPELLIFSGTAVMNPDVDVNHLRNNYIFGNSRITGSLEIEVPLEFSADNLQFADTTGNFLADLFRNKMIQPEDIMMLKMDIKAANGFPLEASLNISLYDSAAGIIRSTVRAPDVLKPASLNEQGRVTDVSETYTTIEFSKAFLSNINLCDRIIFNFIINTPENEESIKIYSDYRIDFSSKVTIKAQIRLNK